MRCTVREETGATHAGGNIARAVAVPPIDGLAAIDNNVVDRQRAKDVGRRQACTRANPAAPINNLSDLKCGEREPRRRNGMKVEGAVVSCTCRPGADDDHLVVQMKALLRVALCHVWSRGGKQEKLEETCGEVALMFVRWLLWLDRNRGQRGERRRRRTSRRASQHWCRGRTFSTSCSRLLKSG